MPTQFHKSAWGRRRSWSPAEEYVLNQCLLGLGEEDAFNLEALATYFRREVSAIKSKIRSMGFDIPGPGKGYRPCRFAEDQLDTLVDYYEEGWSVVEVTFLASMRFRISVTSQTMTKYLRKRGAKIRPAGRPQTK